ncbi:MAG: hypothetical protein HJJLKODD_01214 [Phycisphaerae bacterium]|nr:hypothetical protein [Phycisphaerae bacterium]
MHKTFTAEIMLDNKGELGRIEFPFEPKALFGKVRAAVRVTVRGYSYRSTIFSMGGCCWVPIKREHREQAGVEPGDRVRVRLELDQEPRVIEVPADFQKAIAANPKARQCWEKLSYSHRREYVEAIVEAKKSETRQRRIDGAIRMLLNRGR